MEKVNVTRDYTKKKKKLTGEREISSSTNNNMNE